MVPVAPLDPLLHMSFYNATDMGEGGRRGRGEYAVGTGGCVIRLIIQMYIFYRHLLYISPAPWGIISSKIINLRRDST